MIHWLFRKNYSKVTAGSLPRAAATSCSATHHSDIVTGGGETQSLRLPLHPGPAFIILQVTQDEASLHLPLGRTLNLGSGGPDWTHCKTRAEFLHLSEPVTCQMGIINSHLWGLL